MSVSNISSSTDLYQLLQSTTGDASQGTAATDLAALGSNPATATTDEAQGATKHHHHHGGGGKLQSQIESAVTQALQNSDSSTDPNKTIQDAMAAVLKANGSTGTTATTNPGTPGTAAAGTTNATDAQQQFAQLLQAHGVNPKQFQNDLQTALQDAQGSGSVDFSKVFSSFPAGSAVDTTG